MLLKHDAVFFETAFLHIDEYVIREIEKVLPEIDKDEDRIIPLFKKILIEYYNEDSLQLYCDEFVTLLIQKEIHYGFYNDLDANEIDNLFKRKQFNSKKMKLFLKHAASFFCKREIFQSKISYILNEFEGVIVKKIKGNNIDVLQNSILFDLYEELSESKYLFDSNLLNKFENEVNLNKEYNFDLEIDETAVKILKKLMHVRRNGHGNFSMPQNTTYKDLNAFFRVSNAFKNLPEKYQNSIELINCVGINIMSSFALKCLEKIQNDKQLNVVLFTRKPFSYLESNLFVEFVVQPIINKFYPRSLDEVVKLVDVDIVSNILLDKISLSDDVIRKGKGYFENFINHIYGENVNEFKKVFYDEKYLFENRRNVNGEVFDWQAYYGEKFLTNRRGYSNNYFTGFKEKDFTYENYMNLIFYSVSMIRQYSDQIKGDFNNLLARNFSSLISFIYSNVKIETILHNNEEIREKGFNDLSKLLNGYNIEISSDMKKNYYCSLLERCIATEDEQLTYSSLEQLGDKVFSFAIDELKFYKNLITYSDNSIFKNNELENVESMSSADFQYNFVKVLKLNDIYISYDKLLLEKEDSSYVDEYGDKYSIYSDSFEMLLGALVYDIGIRKTLDFIYDVAGIKLDKVEYSFANKIKYPEYFNMTYINNERSFNPRGVINSYKIILYIIFFGNETREKIRKIHDMYMIDSALSKNDNNIFNYIVDDYFKDNKFTFNDYRSYLNMEGE
ncbi:MAG: hypothetical protein R3Y64_10195 [Peptostreptococcaceae bacterium]